MLIGFTVGNFLSFNTKRTLSFKAAAISDLDNVFTADNYKLLRSAVVYGANSSGKSNLIKALDRMRNVLLNSVKLNDKDPLDYSPFLLSEQSEHAPTHFEAEFLIAGKTYRYGFEYTLENIVNEWLFVKPKAIKKETALFIRTAEGIGVANIFEEGKGKEEATNDNRLFVSLVAQLGGEISKQIIDWFRNYNVISGLAHQDYHGLTIRMLHDKKDGCEQALSLFHKLKLGFQEILVKESEFSMSELPLDLPDTLKSKFSKDLTGKKILSIKTMHNKYDSQGIIVDSVAFDTERNESEGTKKIIDLAGPVFDSLLSGRMLIIDELDAKLHPLLTIQLVRLFNNKETNPNNSQLLFATHDTNLLSADLFRRDQVWFTEKDEFEQTDLYSLVEFRLPDGSKVRNDSNLEKNYIRGRYGAIPYINGL
ncbi:MAG: putative abortive infection protein [Firmicutes bacterium]|nr:putative abortive infection protein [Bacillota bacterium]